MTAGTLPTLTGVRQTLFGQGEHGEWGNCMQACLATVLGVPLEAVPHFLKEGAIDGWWDKMNAWLVEEHGLAVIGVTLSKEWTPPPVLHLMVGKTVRNTDHVVVGFGGQMVWDPHPSDDGLTEAAHAEFLVVVNPRRPMAIL